MAPQKRPRREASAASSTRRQTRSASMAVSEHQTTPTGSQPPDGNLQATAFPRRFARQDQRPGSVESVATADLQQTGSSVHLDDHRDADDIRDAGMPAIREADEQNASQPEKDADGDGEEEGEEEDDDGLSIEDVFDYILPDLATNASRMFKLIDETETADAKKNFWKSFRLLGDSLEHLRGRLTAKAGCLIPLDAVVRRLPTGFGQTSRHRQLREAAASANLIMLLRTVMQISRGDDILAKPILAELDDMFPSELDFWSDQTIEDLRSSYDLAFRVRAHLLAKRIADTPSTSPLILAAELFCGEDAPRLIKHARSMLLDGPYALVGFQDVNEPGEIARDHSQRMGNLCSRLSSKDHDEILNHIEALYPQEDLMADLGNWALARFKSTQSHNRRSSTRNEEGTHVSRDHSDSTSEPEELVIRTEPIVTSYLDGSAGLERTVAHNGKMASKTPPSNQQAVRNVLAGLNPEEVVNNNRARSQQAHSATPQSQGSKKRRFNAELQDSEDEAFQVDSRTIDKGRRIVIENRSPTESKQARAPGALHAPQGQVGRSVSLNASATAMDHEEAKLSAEDILRLSQQARTNSRMARGPRSPKRRVFWSNEDTLRLIEAVRQYNCAWSIMEEKLVFETARTQQQIRDKARNVKVDFLKADHPLPAGFDGVALGQKERKAVISVGRNPDRREDDLDEDGIVINAVYDPCVGDANRFMQRASRDQN